MSLKGKRVIIIGGSSGIGLATARAAAEQGAKVLIASRSREKLESARNEAGGRLGTVVLDVTREEEVRNFFERAGEFDHLVTTAAEGITGPFLELPRAEAQTLFDSKFWGQYRAARYAARQIREGGSITFFSGVAAQKPLPGFSAFAAVNGAINALARALAVEIAPVRVNAVSPGIVDTPAYAGMPAEERQEFFDRTAAALPAGRIGLPEEAAEAVLFSCAAASSPVPCSTSTAAAGWSEKAASDRECRLKECKGRGRGRGEVMGRLDRSLPPGPNPRGDQMTEKDQRQLRRHTRRRALGRISRERWMESWRPPIRPKAGGRAKRR